MHEEKINVLLVDDHAMVRNGVRMMLSAADNICVVAEAENAQDAVRLVQLHEIDVALVDISMPGKNGLELLKILKMQQPKLAVLMLSMYSEEVYAVRALKLGAAGYLTKNSPEATLIEAVRKAAAGGKYVSPSLVEQFADMLGGGRLASHEALSDRELEVLKLIASGESLVKIGSLLHLSPSTVTTYRARILEKMGLKTNTDLARYASQNGLVM
ncbi:response regulator transcription factor RqpR [soil metagenome]